MDNQENGQFKSFFHKIRHEITLFLKARDQLVKFCSHAFKSVNIYVNPFGLISFLCPCKIKSI